MLFHVNAAKRAKGGVERGSPTSSQFFFEREKGKGEGEGSGLKQLRHAGHVLQLRLFFAVKIKTVCRLQLRGAKRREWVGREREREREVS